MTSKYNCLSCQIIGINWLRSQLRGREGRKATPLFADCMSVSGALWGPFVRSSDCCCCCYRSALLVSSSTAADTAMFYLGLISLYHLSSLSLHGHKSGHAQCIGNDDMQIHSYTCINNLRTTWYDKPRLAFMPFAIARSVCMLLSLGRLWAQEKSGIKIKTPFTAHFIDWHSKLELIVKSSQAKYRSVVWIFYRSYFTDKLEGSIWCFTGTLKLIN